MAWRKLSAWTTFEILPFSTCTLCQQKSNISKDIQTIFEVFASARRFWGWAFGCKVSAAQIFYFWNGMAKTFRINNIWNFATFNLYTVPAKIQYLQRYSTDFRNLCLSSKILREGVWVLSFSRANILLLEWHGENFPHQQHLKFCHFQPVHCASKNPISPKIFNRFSKSLPQLKDIEGGRLGVKFQPRKYFTFGMAWWKLCASTTFEILLLSTCTLCQQKSYISNGIQPIFEIFASARRYWGRAFWWKVSYTQVLQYLQWQRENFAHPQHMKFCHFQPVHCASKDPISSKVFNRFSKSLHQQDDVEGRNLGGKFHMRSCFIFASTTYEILPLSTCTLWQQKSYISKCIQTIFEIFTSAQRDWGSAFGWKVSYAQVFYFCNGKVKTLLVDNIWYFSSFNMNTFSANILYLQRY